MSDSPRMGAVATALDETRADRDFGITADGPDPATSATDTLKVGDRVVVDDEVIPEFLRGAWATVVEFHEHDVEVKLDGTEDVWKVSPGEVEKVPTFEVGDRVVSTWQYNEGQQGTVTFVAERWYGVKFDDDKPPRLMKPSEIVPALSDEPIPFLLNTYDVTDPAEGDPWANPPFGPEEAPSTLGWHVEPFAPEPWTDWVANPPHYVDHPSGVECWDVAQHYPYLIGSAFKYLWRTDLKDEPVENLEKAVACIRKEIERRSA